MNKREEKLKKLAGYTKDDFNKTDMYSVDGFGSLQDYFMSNYVEVMEFYGDYYDSENSVLHENRMITIVDRCTMVRDVEIPTYDSIAPIYHVGWRMRPDNEWAMGPLDNLVGMQYRIDHLENAKADAYDLLIHPPLKIIGEVESFAWGPGAEIHLDEGGDVQELVKGLQNVLASDGQIELLESRMELYAGAPREAAGVRSPGEKTAFEVQALENAAGRIFQVKIVQFETELLEPLLNGMLEQAHRNFSATETIRDSDNDLGVASFIDITKEDISAKGILRPVGARHFAQKAQELQNINGIFQNPTIAQMIAPHTSAINLTKYLNDAMDIRGYEIFRPNVGIEEQKETQSLSNQAQEDLDVQAQVATETEAEGF